MNVVEQLEFKAGRKEPLGGLIRRVATLFETHSHRGAVPADYSAS
jgi:hypothetical protein